MTGGPAYDVAVVGAGPAGSRTAQVLAARGLRVALLERDQAPGTPVHCTGIVSTECFERYAFPEHLVLRDISSFVLRSPSGRGAPVRRRAVQARVLDRVGLDRELALRAVAAGAELVTSARVVSVDRRGSRTDLLAQVDGTPMRLSARAAVLATGYGSALSRRLGFSVGQEVVSGCQAVVSAPDVDELEVFTGDALGRGGFGWLVPWKPGTALVGLLSRTRTVDHMRALIARLQDEGRVGPVEQIFHCRAIPVGIPHHAVAEGMLAVGDVVGQVKPTSGGGIYYGLLAADAAADVLASALERGEASATALAPYEKRWRALLEPEISQGVLLRRALEGLPEPVVEHLHRLLRVPGVQRLLIAPSFDWHSGPLTRVLRRLQRHATAGQPAAS
jgi:digeranylgeranylglycerophospholipid reductase